MRCVLFALLTVFAAAPAFAKTIKHTQAGVQYQVPDTWKVAQTGETVEVNTPDDVLYLVFAGVPKATLEGASAEVAKMLAKTGMAGLEFKSKPQEQIINGIPMVLLEGTAKAEGQPMEIGMITAVPVTGTQALLLVGIHRAGNTMHDEAMMKLLKSIKPLATAKPAGK